MEVYEVYKEQERWCWRQAPIPSCRQFRTTSTGVQASWGVYFISMICNESWGARTGEVSEVESDSQFNHAQVEYRNGSTDATRDIKGSCMTYGPS